MSASPMTESARRRLLAVLFAGVLLGALDIAIVGPALPVLRTAFDVDARRLSWVFVAYVLASQVGAAPMAALSDRLGRRSVYVADVLLFAAGALVVAAAPSFGVLVAGRALQGLGASGIFPVAAAVIGDTFPPERRGRALGLIGAVFGIAFIVGPLVGALILSVASWRALFVIHVPLAALVVAGAMRVVPSARAVRPRTFDALGSLGLAASLGALTVGINGLEGGAVALGRSVAALAVAAAALALFARHERRVSEPILRVGLLAAPAVAIAAVVAVVVGIAESAVVFVPEMLVQAFGVTPGTAALMLLPIVLAMAVGAPAAGRALDARGSRTVVTGGVLLLAAGMAGAGTVASPAADAVLAGLTGGLGLAAGAARTLALAQFYAAGALVGLGMSALLGAPLRYILLAAARPDERAASQAFVTLGTGTGQLIGGALIGAVVGMVGGAAGYRLALGLIALLSIALFPLARALPDRAAERIRVRPAAP